MTIEERVKELVTNIVEDCIDFGSREVLIGKMDEYITNALTEQDRNAREEQQDIDIQRAVDKMKGILSMPIMKYITKSDVQPLLDELVKAMKGE